MSIVEEVDSHQSIRSISRGLAVLRAVNRCRPASLTDITNEVGIPYPSVCRIVHTLVGEALIERVPNSKRYRPTAMVRALSAGYQAEDELVSVAREHIVQLCEDIVWPVSIATRVGQWMMLLDSTHHMTSLTFSNYSPGYTLPLTECATGKVYLAYTEGDQRRSILQNLHNSNPQLVSEGRLKTLDDEYWESIREQGFATQYVNTFNAEPGKTSSMAVPIMLDGQIFAALAVIFFRTSLSLDAARTTYLEQLRTSAEKISMSLNQSN